MFKLEQWMNTNISQGTQKCVGQMFKLEQRINPNTSKHTKTRWTIACENFQPKSQESSTKTLNELCGKSAIKIVPFVLVGFNLHLIVCPKADFHAPRISQTWHQRESIVKLGEGNSTLEIHSFLIPTKR